MDADVNNNAVDGPACRLRLPPSHLGLHPGESLVSASAAKVRYSWLCAGCGDASHGTNHAAGEEGHLGHPSPGATMRWSGRRAEPSAAKRRTRSSVVVPHGCRRPWGAVLANHRDRVRETPRWPGTPRSAQHPGRT